MGELYREVNATNSGWKFLVNGSLQQYMSDVHSGGADKWGWGWGKTEVAMRRFLYTAGHKCTFIRTNNTHTWEVNGMGCIGWGTPAAEVPSGGRGGCQEHYPPFVNDRVPHATILMKWLTAVFGFHQAWQWEPQLPISLDPYLQCCRPF